MMKTAWIVRKVFDLALSGMVTRKFASVMNAENIPTPNERKKELTNMDCKYNRIIANPLDYLWLQLYTL